jgi:hypothetical protein
LTSPPIDLENPINIINSSSRRDFRGEACGTMWEPFKNGYKNGYCINIIWGFPKIGVPWGTPIQNQTTLVLRPIVLGTPHFRKPPYAPFSLFFWLNTLLFLGLMLYFGTHLDFSECWLDAEVDWRNEHVDPCQSHWWLFGPCPWSQPNVMMSPTSNWTTCVELRDWNFFIVHGTTMTGMM